MMFKERRKGASAKMILLFGMLFLACVVPLLYAEKDGSSAMRPYVSSSRIQIVCHRGVRRLAPENAYAAARKVIDLGADYIEDIRTTADGIMINMHDPTVHRTTNGSGRVDKLTIDQISKLNVGRWFGREFAGERIPVIRKFLLKYKR